MLPHVFHGLNLVAVQLISFELNYITPWNHHTTGQKDPRIDKRTPLSPGSSLQQAVLGNRSNFMYIHYPVLFLQRAIRARRSYLFLDPFHVY